MALLKERGPFHTPQEGRVRRKTGGRRRGDRENSIRRIRKTHLQLKLKVFFLNRMEKKKQETNEKKAQSYR